jgi:hypothetical protein
MRKREEGRMEKVRKEGRKKDRETQTEREKERKRGRETVRQSDIGGRVQWVYPLRLKGRPAMRCHSDRTIATRHTAVTNRTIPLV